MKIAFIVNNEYPGLQASGGIGVFVRNLCLGLIQNSCRPEVILLSSIMTCEEHRILENIPIHIIPLQEANGFLGLWRQRRRTQAKIEAILTKGEFDFVEVSTSDSFLYRKLKHHRVLARTHGSLSYALKHYYRSSGSITKWLQLKHERILLKQAFRVLCVSKQYYEHYNHYKHKLVLIPNFIGQEFTSQENASHPLPHSYIFFHGTIKDIKGVKELAEAFMKSEFAATHKLVLAGKADKSYLHSIEAICKDKLLYLGECDAQKLKTYLRHCEVAVYPSKRDAFNLAVVEAMSQEVLIICSSAIDSEIIQDGVNGIVCPLEKLNHLHEYLNKVQGMSDEDKSKLKSASYSGFKSKYSFEVGIRQNLKLYQAISA